MDRKPPVDDVLDAVAEASQGIEDSCAFRKALVLDDLDPGPVANRVGAILDLFVRRTSSRTEA